MQVEIDTLLAQCDKTIARLREDLRVEERLRQRLLEIKGCPIPSPEQTVPGISIPGVSVGGHRPSGTVIAGSLLSHVGEVLRTEGRPMRAREIADRVEARGYATNAKGGLKIAVSTVLAHNQGKAFRKVEPGVYELLNRATDAKENKEGA